MIGDKEYYEPRLLFSFFIQSALLLLDLIYFNIALQLSIEVMFIPTQSGIVSKSSNIASPYKFMAKLVKITQNKFNPNPMVIMKVFFIVLAAKTKAFGAVATGNINA